MNELTGQFVGEIAANVYRRVIDAFAMFTYIGKLRKGAKGESTFMSSSGKTIDETKKIIHKKAEFVSAADIFNTLPKEQKETLEEWFVEKADRRETTLIKELRNIEKQMLEADERYDELMDSTRSYQERETTLKEMLEDRDSKIAELTDVDFEGELEDRDAKIRVLQNQKRKLTHKLKESQETPDLHAILSDAIGKQLAINSVLKEILQYRDSLNQSLLKELLEAVHRTVKILKDVQTTEQNAQKELPE